jgi:hypothetical protein
MSVVTARSSQFGLALSMRAVCFFEGSWAQFEQWAYCKREGEFRSAQDRLFDCGPSDLRFFRKTLLRYSQIALD